jgi:hypothetical protein
MIGRLALRSLTAHPVRTAVLSAGFGVGVAVMAILLGVAGIVLEQAQAPALVGGGDVLIRLSDQVPARLVMTGTLQSDALRSRVRTASPRHATTLYLLREGRSPLRLPARAGIPSLQRALGDEETAGIAAWVDSSGDRAWTEAAPDTLLRQVDRFHPVPDAPEWQDSWAEWLYFNGRSAEARFYLTFLVGPSSSENGRTGRAAGVRLQLERQGRMESYSGSALLSDAEIARAPDLAIGGSSVRLDGMRYRVHLDLGGRGGARATGDLTLQATAGRMVPPLEIAGAQGWRTGYVVPVMSGALDGRIEVNGEEVSFAGGTGYHDHNWGFWKDVSWQWGQVQHGDVSFIYGRVFPPREAADPERMPGFVGALGPDGPLGYAPDVRIVETDDAGGQPRTVRVRARGTALDLTLRFDVGSVETTRMAQGPLANRVNFLQMRGTYSVEGRAGDRDLSFTAPGAAETFRGARSQR